MCIHDTMSCINDTVLCIHDTTVFGIHDTGFGIHDTGFGIHDTNYLCLICMIHTVNIWYACYTVSVRLHESVFDFIYCELSPIKFVQKNIFIQV